MNEMTDLEGVISVSRDTFIYRQQLQLHVVLVSDVQ